MNFSGWRLLGQFPDNDDGVGSWLLYHGGEAMLLEIPPGLKVAHVQKGLKEIGARLCYVTASHAHEDHFDNDIWKELKATFPNAEFMNPNYLRDSKPIGLGGEMAWFLVAPKHSMSDMVTVFRGVAMTGDIELGQLESVNKEVHDSVKRKSMKHLQDFPMRTGYHVHSVMSSHLNDLRTNVNWPELFRI